MVEQRVQLIKHQHALQRGNQLRVAPRPHDFARAVELQQLHARRTQTLATRVNLKAESPEQSLWQLSGGNQQKVVFARAMAEAPRLLLLDEPTRGVDIGARAEIYKLIRDLSAQGCAVLMASSDLPELLGLCDRILILHQGRQHQILTPKNLAPNDLLHACYPSEPALT